MNVFVLILKLLLAVIVGYILFLCICALFVNPKREYDKESKFYRAVLNGFTAIGLWWMRIRITVTGAEKVPQNGKLLFVSNHRSNFDPIITWHVFKRNRIAYISKAGNFKIPVFGRLIRKCCFMTIDRESPRRAIGTINKAAELLKKQEVSIGVYPEGTRAKDGVMLPFHNGVLRIAQKAESPIVVLAISGTEKIHKNYPFKRSYIHLDVVDVIPAETVIHTKTAELGENMKNKISERLSQLEQTESHE